MTAATNLDTGLMRCLACGISKPPAEFDKSHRRGASFKARCRACGPAGGGTPRRGCGELKPLAGAEATPVPDTTAMLVAGLLEAVAGLLRGGR